jgi:hypothetical protein
MIGDTCFVEYGFPRVKLISLWGKLSEEPGQILPGAVEMVRPRLNPISSGQYIYID